MLIAQRRIISCRYSGLYPALRDDWVLTGHRRLRRLRQILWRISVSIGSATSTVLFCSTAAAVYNSGLPRGTLLHGTTAQRCAMFVPVIPHASDCFKLHLSSVDTCATRSADVVFTRAICTSIATPCNSTIMNSIHHERQTGTNVLVYVIIGFHLYSRNVRSQFTGVIRRRIFQEWIAPKSMATDQDNLRVTFSA